MPAPSYRRIRLEIIQLVVEEEEGGRRPGQSPRVVRFDRRHRAYEPGGVRLPRCHATLLPH